MINQVFRCHCSSLLPLQWLKTLPTCSVTRWISTELTAALRPFYFAVHPDLFGQHPKQRRTNEDSLKQLSAHIECLYERKYQVLHEAKTLQFYIRDSSARSRDTFKLIKITLDERTRDPKMIIQRLLELCNLPTEYIKNVKPLADAINSSAFATPNDANSTMSDFNAGRDYKYGGTDFSNFEYSYNETKKEEKKTLKSWIIANATLARSRAAELADLKEEVAKLQTSVMRRLQLRDLRYDCGWNYEHYRGCLKTLERLANLHETHMGILNDRIVVFAAFTGISIEGHVMLYTGDVLNNWIDFIKNIPKHDEFLKKIPLYESTLSQVLLKIKIGRRKFMPKHNAVGYAGHLMKVTTTLNDYLSYNKYPDSWPKTLENYEIVIESEAGPLMVSPTGQLIAPATCPGFMLIDFISSNLTVAKERMAKYQEQKHVERELIMRCLDKLYLKSLTKEDSVTPGKMIETLNHLLKYEANLFHNIHLQVANYYSVLSDGTVCIPWDFMSR